MSCSYPLSSSCSSLSSADCLAHAPSSLLISVQDIIRERSSLFTTLPHSHRELTAYKYEGSAVLGRSGGGSNVHFMRRRGGGGEDGRRREGTEIEVVPVARRVMASLGSSSRVITCGKGLRRKESDTHFAFAVSSQMLTRHEGGGRSQKGVNQVPGVSVQGTQETGEGKMDAQLPAEIFFTKDSRPIILFDGVCNMCNAGVNFVLDNDPQGAFRFAALQSTAGQSLLQRSGRSPTDISSIVLVEKDRSYIKSEAVLRIARLLSFPFPPLAALALLSPLFIRDVVYDGVANNRYSILGKKDQCRLTDDRFTERFIS